MEGPAVSFCLSDLTASNKTHRLIKATVLSFCYPAQSTCLLQVEKEMTLQNRDGGEARRAGRQNFSPARKGWGSIPNMI